MEVDMSASLSLICETTYNTLWPANSAPPLHHGNRFKSWLQKLKLNWKQIFQVHHQEQLQELLDKHKSAFEDKLGCIKGAKVKFYLKPDAKPRLLWARNVPSALKEKIEAELEWFVEADVIEPVQQSEWSTPIVPVVKQNGDVRICGDYRVTLN